MAHSDKIKNVVGLQIDGTVGPNDSVGMHISMPNQPGTGVTIDVNELDTELTNVINNISNDDPKASEVKDAADSARNAIDGQMKLNKVRTLVQIASGIASIATNIAKIKQLTGL